MGYGSTFPRVGIAEQPSPWKYLTNFAREAERMGCAYGVVGDRLEAGIDPFSVLTAIAEASGRMRLATSVLILPPRGALVASKQYASLDVLTGGRVIAGMGTGSLFRDYEVMGMDHQDMWPRFEEGVRAMRAYLTPDTPPFKGRFYDTEGVTLEPTAVQRPSLPIWIGRWGSQAGLRRVARLADGWLSSAGPGHQSPEQFAEDVRQLNAFLVQAGDDAIAIQRKCEVLLDNKRTDKKLRLQQSALSYFTRRTHASRIYWPGDDGLSHGAQYAQGRP
jgi:alkanesulfonate monooxygenase SsuD/methylene tetrahydromethanopterin reductase-like flavin-dependent oxidoreductase (luciferase family)